MCVFVCAHIDIFGDNWMDIHHAVIRAYISSLE